MCITVVKFIDKHLNKAAERMTLCVVDMLQPNLFTNGVFPVYPVDIPGKKCTPKFV